LEEYELVEEEGGAEAKGPHPPITHTQFTLQKNKIKAINKSSQL
jgi:hypothetical protein